MNTEQHISIRFRVYRHTAHDVIRPCISAFKLLVPTSIPTTRIQPMIVRLLCTHMIHRLLAAITLSYDSGVCFRIAFTPLISSPLRLASSRTAPHPSRSFSPPPYSVHTMFASPSSCTTGPHFTPYPWQPREPHHRHTLSTKYMYPTPFDHLVVAILFLKFLCHLVALFMHVVFTQDGCAGATRCQSNMSSLFQAHHWYSLPNDLHKH